MNKSCHSCGIPLAGEDGKDYRTNYCLYCTDENGNLYPKEIVQKGLAKWLQKWAPETGSVDFMKRAESYMKAMPAWAEV